MRSFQTHTEEMMCQKNKTPHKAGFRDLKRTGQARLSNIRTVD